VDQFRGWTSLVAVRFASNSRLRAIHGFDSCTSLCRIEIPASVQIISIFGFMGCSSLNEIVFASNSRLRELRGFRSCTSLHRIEILAYVKIISCSGFFTCSSLNEIIIKSDSRLRELRGFCSCTSLHRIEIAPSVEIVDGFNGRSSVLEAIIREIGSQKSRDSSSVFWGFETFLSLRLPLPSQAEPSLPYSNDRRLKLIRCRLHLYCH
jgi:hypothetical protein